MFAQGTMSCSWTRSGLVLPYPPLSVLTLPASSEGMGQHDDIVVQVRVGHSLRPVDDRLPQPEFEHQSTPSAVNVLNEFSLSGPGKIAVVLGGDA